MTYPDAIFAVNIRGTIEETGKGGFAGTLPWDDGEHAFFTQRTASIKGEPVTFEAYSYIEGIMFGFPESIYQENQSESYIYYTTKLYPRIVKTSYKNTTNNSQNKDEKPCLCHYSLLE